jgi:hypothetical protein
MTTDRKGAPDVAAVSPFHVRQSMELERAGGMSLGLGNVFSRRH